MKTIALLSVEEERSLSARVTSARVGVWEALLSLNPVLEAVLETCMELSESQGRVIEVESSKIFQLIAASRRAERKKIEVYKTSLRKARTPVAKSISDSDPCLDIGLPLIRKVKTWHEPNDSSHSEYIKNIDKSLNVYLKRRNEFIERNMKLVAAIARRHLSHGIPYEDLVQEGALGLHRAVGMFNPDMGWRFSTYASWWIRATIFRYCRNRSRIVRIPINTQEKIERYHSAVKDFDIKGKPYDIRKVSKMTGMSEKSMDYIRGVLLDNCRSTETDIGGITIGDTLSDHEIAASTIETRLDAGIVREIISGLPERQRYIINARFGLESGDPMTLQEIADVFDMSRERIRQIESIALGSIREVIKV